MTAHNPSVEELRRESERSRAALASSVVELREKVSDTAEDLKAQFSPAHLKEEVKDYVRERSEDFFHSLERKARENPLQTVAIGAGLAYPLWGVLKSIPVPIMLIGAGLWLSRQKPAGGNGEGLADKAKAAAAEGVSQVTETVRGAGAALAAGAEAVSDKVRATAQDIRDSVTEMGQGVAGIVKDKTTGVAGLVKDKTTDATDTVSSVASDLGAKALQFGNRSRNTFEDLVDRNPLLVAGVGLAIGAFIAASLPSSDVENRMFGERSDELKDKAREAVSQGVERAKDTASGMMDEMTGAAAREGLDGEGLAKAVQGVTEGVRSVVDKGVRTALGEDERSPGPQPPTSFQTSKS